MFRSFFKPNTTNAEMALSLRYSKRSKSRMAAVQDFVNYLDPNKSSMENARAFYAGLSSPETGDMECLFMLNGLVQLFKQQQQHHQQQQQQLQKQQQKQHQHQQQQQQQHKPHEDAMELGFSTEELLVCLSASWVHSFEQVRAAALRTIRFTLATPKDIKIFNSMQLQHLVCRSLDIVLSNDDERVQAMKLIRKLLAIAPGDVSPAIIRCLVSLVESAMDDSDNLLRVYLATLCECAVLNPTLLIVCGGVTTITRNVIECHNPRIVESMCGVLLYLLEWPHTRDICGVRLDCLAAPYCDFQYRQGKINKNNYRLTRETSKVRYTSCRLALLSILRSWTGTIEFCDPSKPSGLKAIVDALYLNQLDVRKAILDLFYELLNVQQPADTDDYAIALQVIDPADFQGAWLLSNGFVAMEGRSILPSLASRAPNVCEQHLALLLYCLLEAGLLNALVEVIVSTDKHVSVRATILIGKILQLMHTHLPADICSTCSALPTLITYATQGNQNANAAISALQTYHKMLRNRPAPYSLFLDSIIQSGSLLHTRLFRRDVNMHDQQTHVHSIVSPTMAATGLMAGGTLERTRYDSVSSSDDSMSQSSSSRRSSFRLKRKLLPFLENLRVNRLIKESNVLSIPDSNMWDWEVITTILRTQLIRKLDDTTGKFLKRLVHFFKPSSNQFSHHDFVHTQPVPAFVIAGLDLIDWFLANIDVQLDGKRMLTDLFSDIGSHLNAVLNSTRVHDCLFSPQHMNNTMCQQYFLYIGRMCRVPSGIDVLKNTAIFEHMISIISKSEHVCYVKLFVSGLDYGLKSPARQVLEQALVHAKTPNGSLYATQFLTVLLRAGIPDFVVWGIPLIIQQTNHKERAVVLAAFDVLEEACHEKFYLEDIVRIWYNFKSHGDIGRLLMARYYSLPRGLFHERARVKEEIKFWKTGYNKRYVLLVEADTHACLTLHVRNERGYYSRRNCNTRPIIIPPNVPAHLYGQLVQTEQGTTALRSHGDLPHLIEVITRAKMSDDAECLELKAALWAVGHASTHSNGIEYFNESGSRIYEKLVMLATKAEVYSIRATCFSVLGMIGGTNVGANLLFKMNWLSVRHDRTTMWPVHQSEDWASTNYTPVRHYTEEVRPYNYTGIEDQLDASYCTGSYLNLLSGSNSTTREVGVTAGVSSELNEIAVSGEGTSRTGDDLSKPMSASAKSRTLPEGAYPRAAKHQRSLSESKTTDVISLIGGAVHHQHRIRYNSCTDSNTSGVSSCDSVTVRGAPVGDFQQAALSPIQSSSNLAEVAPSASLMRRTSLVGTSYLQNVISPAYIRGYAKLRSLRRHCRPVLSESATDLYEIIDRNDLIAITSFRPRKTSFGESQRQMKVRSLDRQLSLRMYSQDLQVPLPTLAAPKFISSNDSQGPCYAGISLPKNLLDLFPKRNEQRTYVSCDIQDQDLMDINFLTAKDQFLNDSLNNEGGDESSVISSSLSDVSSVSKRSKWAGARHGRNSCLTCSRMRRNRLNMQRIESEVTACDIYSNTSALLIAAGFNATIALGRKNPKSQQSTAARTGNANANATANASGNAAGNASGNTTANITANPNANAHASANTNANPNPNANANANAQSASTIQLSDISFNSPESILSEDIMLDKVTASILYNVQRLANPVSAKQSKLALLELKQRHPATFQDICLYSEVCKTLGRTVYRMNARRFLQELFLDLNFESFYSDAMEILSRKEKELGMHERAIDRQLFDMKANDACGGDGITTHALASEKCSDVGASVGLGLSVGSMKKANCCGMPNQINASSTPSSASMASSSSASSFMAGHKAHMKSHPLASVYETSWENLLVDSSPRHSGSTSGAATQESDKTVLTVSSCSGKVREKSMNNPYCVNKVDNSSNLTQAPPPAAPPPIQQRIELLHNELRINTDDEDEDEEDSSLIATEASVRTDFDEVDSSGFQRNLNKPASSSTISSVSSSQQARAGSISTLISSSNCSDQTIISNRSSICTISQYPIGSSAGSNMQSCSATSSKVENENKKYTRGRFYTLELDLSCTKNKFKITDRSRFNRNEFAALTTTTTATTTAATTTPMTGKPYMGLASLQRQSSLGAASASDYKLPIMRSSYPTSLIVNSVGHVMPTNMADLSPTTPSTTYTITKSLASSVGKPIGSLFCEKRLKTANSEAVLTKVPAPLTGAQTNVATMLATTQQQNDMKNIETTEYGMASKASPRTTTTITITSMTNTSTAATAATTTTTTVAATNSNANASIGENVMDMDMDMDMSMSMSMEKK